MRSMVEGTGRLRLACGARPSTPELRSAVPLPVPGRIS